MKKTYQNQPLWQEKTLKILEFALQQGNILNQAKKYGKIFHVTGVSKGTPFDTSKSF